MTAKTGPRRRANATPGPMVDLAQAVVDRRLSLGLTQADLADLAGVGVSSVRTLEAGRATLSLGAAATILAALGLAAGVGPRPLLQATPGIAILTSTAPGQ